MPLCRIYGAICVTLLFQFQTFLLFPGRKIVLGKQKWCTLLLIGLQMLHCHREVFRHDYLFCSYVMSYCFVLTYSGPASSMVLGSSISIEKTLYEVLSVSEDATYDEIRVAYKSAVLNTHPDKAQTHVESYVTSNEQREFLSVQKAWEILRRPESRADYNKQLLLSRQAIEVVASEIEVGDMIIESTANNTVELLYPCRCGDYFSITSCELGEMGISVSEEGEVEQRAGNSVLADVILGCGSCSLKVRLVIDKTS
ncbi:hypothetical protein BS78_02G205900 [Paspalum vaginatum]|nr:hypothetical protein BS78_02G205900 [Paspalum vaginatum]